MRDFPIFATEYGVSSLILREIPYRSIAYIRVQSCEGENLAAHLRECAAFCRGAGAQQVFFTAAQEPEGYESACDMLRMNGEAQVDPDKLEQLFPVTEATVRRWRQIYNERMRNVDNAGTLEERDEEKIAAGGAYFVHREGKLLGIGWLEDTKLLALASVEPGAGERVLNTLMSVIEGARLELEVASTNDRAIRLYERMGLIRTGLVSRWYKL